MMPYIPSKLLEDDPRFKNLNDQETWNLVGLDPLVLQLHNLKQVAEGWVVTDDDAFVMLKGIDIMLTYVEIVTYDRLSYKPHVCRSGCAHDPGDGVNEQTGFARNH